MEKILDVIIIGGGPAGLSAGIYASRARLSCLLFEKMMPGGQMLLTDIVENFPGFSKPIKGPQLAQEMAAQAGAFGLKTESDEIIAIEHVREKDYHFIVTTASKKAYKTLTVIIASGAVWKKLGVKGEEDFIGKGVSYCATCDAPFFKGKDIVVVGGGDKALEEALYLTTFANSVKLIHRRDRFRAIKEIQERVLANKKITPVYDSNVVEIAGEKLVDRVKVKNVKTGKTDDIPCKGVFILIGIAPNSGILKGLIDVDEKGFVLADMRMRTSQEGIYACGDVIKKSLYQIANAVGEGATAAFSAQKHAEELKGDAYA
jgi:thioredoxin reductase (NADPH)